MSKLPTHASRQRAPAAQPRIVYCGMRGALSLPPLAALLAQGHHICAVVLPGTRGTPDVQAVAPPAALPGGLIPLVNPYVEQTIVELAWQHGIPVLALNRLGGAAALAAIAALEPDLGVVACFSRRIPPTLLRLPPHGFLNIHPALLPAYRGPAPVFWTLRDAAQPGVTLHHMDAELDTGPLVAQAPVALPDGADGAQIDTLLATRGAELLCAALAALEHGPLPAQPQPSTGTQAPWPAAADFAIDPMWPARRAFNFMRGTAEWNQPYPITVDGRAFDLAHALACDPAATLDVPFVRQGRTLRIRCNPGMLEALLAPETA